MDGVSRGRMAIRLAVLLGLIAVAIVGCVFIDSLIDDPIRTPDPSAPASPMSESPAPSATSTSSPASTSSAPPAAGTSIVGDYHCLTLESASQRLMADGFTVGSVNFTMSGGAVDDTWLVEIQGPDAGTTAAPGSPIDLTLSSPFFVCPSASPGP